MNEAHPTHLLFFTVKDPKHLMNGHPVPAMTTVLYRVVNNDHVLFEETTRLIELFMEAAYEKGKADALSLQANPL